MVCAWAEYNFHEIGDIHQLLNKLLLCNSHILIDGSPITNATHVTRAKTMLDLINSTTSKLLTYQEFCATYGATITVLHYNQLISAIPLKWKFLIRQLTPDIMELSFETNLETINNMVKSGQFIYHKLINGTSHQQVIDIWHNKDVALDIDQVKTALNYKRVTRISKYGSFQYRLMYNAIFLNDRLYHLRLHSTQNCEYCEDIKQTYRHMFKECNQTHQIWEKLSQLYHYPFHQLSFDSIVLNMVEDKPNYSYINLVIIVTKQKLYATKCLQRKPNAKEIVEEVNFIKTCEMQQLLTIQQRKHFAKKWEEPLLN